MNLCDNSAWCLIDMIKIFRNATGLGLVQSKGAVESWLTAMRIQTPITQMEDVSEFIIFISAFHDGKLTVNEGGAIVHTKSPVLTDIEIRQFSGR